MGIYKAGPGLLRESFRAAAVRDLFVGGLQGAAGILRRLDERLRPGEIRPLTPPELAALLREADLDPQAAFIGLSY